jgi:hypothetical protein
VKTSRESAVEASPVSANGTGSDVRHGKKSFPAGLARLTRNDENAARQLRAPLHVRASKNEARQKYRNDCLVVKVREKKKKEVKRCGLGWGKESRWKTGKQ